MTKIYDINKGRNNSAFLSDDGKTTFSPAIIEKNVFTLELAEKQLPQIKDKEYDPYKERVVEHPTS